MVVVIILGVLAALALPNFNIQVKKAKSQEAVQVLLAIYGAQKDYAKENDDGNAETPDYTDDINNLDVHIEGLKNFQDPVVNAVVDPCGSSAQYLASIASKDGDYILYVLEDATIVCADGNGNCPAELCTKMGF